ncbi:MAG: hypothetical protein II984_11165 [Clostridia bacterium]|nr:hypothetical protein [Clostridia bacterium]
MRVIPCFDGGILSDGMVELCYKPQGLTVNCNTVIERFIWKRKPLENLYRL